MIKGIVASRFTSTINVIAMYVRSTAECHEDGEKYKGAPSVNGCAILSHTFAPDVRLARVGATRGSMHWEKMRNYAVGGV